MKLRKKCPRTFFVPIQLMCLQKAICGLLIKIFGLFTFQSVKRTGIIVFSLHLFPRMNPSMNQRNRNRKYSSALAVHINGDSDSD